MIEKPPPKVEFGTLFLLAISMRQRMDLFKNLMQSACQKFPNELRKNDLSEIKQLSCGLSRPNTPQFEASIRVHVLVNELYPTFGLESLGATSLLFLENSRQASPDPFDSYDDVLRTKALNYSCSPFSAGEDIDSILLANNISLSSLVSGSQSRLETDLTISTDLSPVDEIIDIATDSMMDSEPEKLATPGECVKTLTQTDSEVPHELLAGLSMDDLPLSVDSGMFNDEDEEEYYAERLSSVGSDDYTVPKENTQVLSLVKLQPGDLSRLPSFITMSSIDSNIFGSPVDGMPSEDFLRQLGGSPDLECDIKPDSPVKEEEEVNIQKIKDESESNYTLIGATANPISFSARESVDANYSSSQASVSSLSSPSRPVDDFYISYNNRRPVALNRRDEVNQLRGSSMTDRRLRLSHRSNGLRREGRSRVSSLHGGSSSVDMMESELRSMSSPRSSQFEEESVYSSGTETSSRKRSRHDDLNEDSHNMSRADVALKDVTFLREAGVPFTYNDVAYSSNEAFRQLRSTLGLSEDKIVAMMDARRRATNRKAAERCRQQKNLERDDLATDLDRVSDKKRDAERQVSKARQRRERAREALTETRQQLFSRIRDSNNQPLHPDNWRFQLSDEGGLVLVKRTDTMT